MTPVEYQSQLQTCLLLGVNPAQHFKFKHGSPFIVTDVYSTYFDSVVSIDLKLKANVNPDYYWFTFASGRIEAFKLMQVMPYELSGNT